MSERKTTYLKRNILDCCRAGELSSLTSTRGTRTEEKGDPCFKNKSMGTCRWTDGKGLSGSASSADILCLLPRSSQLFKQKYLLSFQNKIKQNKKTLTNKQTPNKQAPSLSSASTSGCRKTNITPWWPAGALGLFHSETWKLSEVWSHWLKNQNHKGNGHGKISTELPTKTSTAKQHNRTFV